MARKARSSKFGEVLESLRKQGFEVAPFAGVDGGMMVSKDGAAAVLVAGDTSAVRFAVSPGVLVGGEVARLIDRGFQKFIQTSRFENPATADQLHAIHRFSEELKLLVGASSYYNESLGTTGDLYYYDRLQGREAEIEPERHDD
jgi:hypothetical protein